MPRLLAAGLLGASLLPGIAAAQGAPAFKHIIIVVQENRTPDNLFGSKPNFENGVDIQVTGETSKHQPITLKPVFLDDCYDIAHTHASFELAYTQGFDQEPIDYTKCKSKPADAQFRYVDNSNGRVQPYFDIATQNGFANRMFQTNQGPSFPAHQFLFGGTSAPAVDSKYFAAENPKGGDAGCQATKSMVALIGPNGVETMNVPPCFEHPTLSDLLDAAATPIGWRYYSSNTFGAIWTAPNAIRHICLPLDAKGNCGGADWVRDVVPNTPSQILTDIQACHLPAVSWVIPTGEESDHAVVNKGMGPSWVASIVNAVGAGCATESYWTDTAIFITWDDWGGWFDHVAPFAMPMPPAWGAGYTYGFRVPLLVVSAFTMPGQVSNDIFDFGSILAFVEKNFGLGFIGDGHDAYSRYADYQATLPGRGDLSSFFTLSTAKPFMPIQAPLGAQYFTSRPASFVPPDND